MNQKFRIRTAALIASIAGSALGSGDLPTTLGQTINLNRSAGQQVQYRTGAGLSALPPIVSGQSRLAVPPIVSSNETAKTSQAGMLVPMAPVVAQAISTPTPWKVDHSKNLTTNAAASVPQAKASLSQAGNGLPQRLIPLATTPSDSPAVEDAVPRNVVVQNPTLQDKDNFVQEASAQLSGRPQARLAAGFSSAGIPIYSSTQPRGQGSGSRNMIGSGIQAAPGIQSFPQAVVPQMDAAMQSVAPAISAGSQMVTGGGTSVLYGSPVDQPIGSLSAGSGEYFEPATVGGIGVPMDGLPMGGSDCATCNASGAVGCGEGGQCNCGPGGCYDESDIAMNAGLYGSVGEARQYTHLEALYFDRYDGDINFSTTGSLGDFDFDGGWRFTLGQRYDAINGQEFSYMGSLPLSQSNNSSGTARPVRSGFVLNNSLGLADTALVPFGFIDNRGATPVAINATSQSQFKETYFHSFEVNKVRWGWDVFKSFVGLRYIHVNDKYQLNSVNNNIVAPNNRSGVYRKLAMNNLLGPHIGAEWFYDVGYRLSFSLSGKLGVHANFHQIDTRMFLGDTVADVFTATTPLINESSASGAFSTSMEANLIAHYQLSPRGRLRIGYNALHLGELATVSDNILRDVTQIPGTGGGATTDSDDMTFQGFSFGFEIFR